MANKPSFEYDDTTPEGWDPGVYRRQEGLGGGISLRHGMKPPEADEVAPRGTPAWRQAWTRMQDWIGKQLYTGATLGDMGFTREHEHGKQHFLRLSEGKFGGFRRGWAEQAGSHGRAYIDPYTGQYRMSSFGTGGGQGSPAMGMNPNGPAPVTGLNSTGPAGPSGPSAMPFTPPAPVVAPSASMGGGGGAPVSAQDVYAQFPRGGKKRMAFGAPSTFGGAPMGGPAPPVLGGRPGGGGPDVRSLATLIRKYRGTNY